MLCMLHIYQMEEVLKAAQADFEHISKVAKKEVKHPI